MERSGSFVLLFRLFEKTYHARFRLTHDRMTSEMTQKACEFTNP